MLRTEYSAGVIASTIANVNREKNTQAFIPTDFTLHFTHQSASDEPIQLNKAMMEWI